MHFWCIDKNHDNAEIILELLLLGSGAFKLANIDA